MPQIIINYPANKALRIYNALIEHFQVEREIYDAQLGGNRPKTNAELKADVDRAIRQFLIDRIKAIEERDKIIAARVLHSQSFESPGITE